MNLHEYQGKQLFAQYGLPVSIGVAAQTPAEAVAAASTIGGDTFVVKAQVHAGGRGKAGGVKLVNSKAEIEAFAKQWLGNNLVTYQTEIGRASCRERVKNTMGGGKAMKENAIKCGRG